MDIVERLRAYKHYSYVAGQFIPTLGTPCQEAADEIVRLRTMLAELEPLTPRAIRVLRTAGITTKEEAIKLWHNDFLRMPTCGRKTAHEIYEWARR